MVRRSLHATALLGGYTAVSVDAGSAREPGVVADRDTTASRELVLDAVEALFVEFDPDAAGRYLHPEYIQHNASVPSGAAPILGFLPALKEAGLRTETHRVLAEGDLVVLHVTYTGAEAFGAAELVAFDVFRVADGVIVEHWDNLAPVAPPGPSGHTQTDGPSEITAHASTAANKALVTGFIDTVLRGGAIERIADFISTETYIQHASGIADGLDGLGAALEAMAEGGIAMTYDETHLVVAEGDFVFAASEGTLGGEPTAFFDLFRVSDGRIVEHWDVVSSIPAEMAHDNGKF